VRTATGYGVALLFLDLDRFKGSTTRSAILRATAR
jgi:hypothetical protein